MDELKPCPFCGGIESLDVREVHTYNRYCADMYCIECRRCLYCTMNFDTKDELYAFWNTRPAEEALKSENAELRYIVEQFFDDWYCEDGCPKQKDKKFPCSGEEENETTAEFYPGECSFYQTKCWVEYYRWKYRQAKEQNK